MDVTLIVKASNQQCEDLTIKCEPSWTIRRLKGHLTEVYPGKPSTDEQKLIYSGQLLGDSVVLKDVLRQYDGQQAHTVHLVFTPKNSYYGGGGSSSSSSGSKSNTNSKMVSNASTSAAGTSSSNSSNSSTPVGATTSSYERSSRDGVNNVEETNGDGLRQRSVSQARSAARTTNPRPSQFVEHTAALQNFMQHTYMQYLNQYINLINGQTNANALYAGSGLPGANGSAETVPTTINPLSGNQPFPAVPFVPIVQSATMAGGFPNFAYYPCMTSAPYASGFPTTSNIPTASADASNGSVPGVLPGVQSSPNSFLSSSTHPSTGMASASGQQIPSPQQIPGIVNPTSSSSSSIEAGDANAATTPATAASGTEAAVVAPADQGAPQDAAPAEAAAAPARARRFPNIVVEEQENNDWLDVFFSMCRFGILITVIYLYSSPIRCLTVLFIGVMLYLKKHLDRVYQAIDRRIPRLQANQEANGAVAQREQQPAVAQPNNNVPENNPEQQLPNEPDVGAAGVESVAKTRNSEPENATATTSDHQGSSSSTSSNDASVVLRPRTSSGSRSTEQPTNTVAEEQQQQTNSEGEPGAAAEQPAAEGQRMTFNDMTSFLGTLVITFFTSIIPDTPAA